MKLNLLLSTIATAIFFSATAFAAKDIVCHKEPQPIESGTFKNVYVAAGTSCTLAGTDADAGGITIEGNVISDKAQSVIIGSIKQAADQDFPLASVVVKGNVNIRRTVSDVRINPGTLIEGNLTISRSGPNSVIVLETSPPSSPLQTNGHVSIKNNQSARIVILEPRIDGHLFVTNNNISGDFPDPDNPDDGVYGIFPIVGGNTIVSGNRIGEELIPEENTTREHSMLWLQSGFGGDAQFSANSGLDRNIAIGLSGEIPGNLTVFDNSAAEGVLLLAFFSDLLVSGNLIYKNNLVTDVTPVFALGFEGNQIGRIGGFENFLVKGNALVDQNESATGLPLTIFNLKIEKNLKCVGNNPSATLSDVSVGRKQRCGD